MFQVSKRLMPPLVVGTICFGLARAAQLTALPQSQIAAQVPLANIEDKPPVEVAGSSPSSNFSFSNASVFPAHPVAVATLQAQDSVEDNPPEGSPKFSLRGFTPDEAHLVISKTEIGAQVNDFANELITTFEVVDLNGNTSKPLLKIQEDADFFLGPPGSKSSVIAKSSSTTDPDKPWLFFKPATEALPPKDAVKSFTPDELSGRAVYVEDVPLSGTGDDTRWGTFVVLRRFGEGVSAVQTFAVVSNGFGVFTPQWSPDGNRLLLKVGTQGDSISRYLIYLWNPQRGRIQQGPKEEIAYLQPRWSPDSARIAYVVGGDISGINGFLAGEPTSLHVYDVTSGQSRKLVTQFSGGLVPLAQFQWQNANSLLYAAYQIPPSKKPQEAAPADKDKKQEIRPAIFEIAAIGGAPKLIVKAAFYPMPSPDGHWIAFFGWPEDDNAQEEQKSNPQSRFFGPRLFLWDTQAKRRFLVQPNIFKDNVQMMWTPDSHKLVLLQSSYNSKTAQRTACISALAIEQND